MARNEKDIVSKKLEELNDVFADIYNVYLFDGQIVINKDDLIIAPTLSSYITNQKIKYQEQDIAKYYKKNNIVFTLCSLENQTAEDPDMTLRMVAYDGAHYHSQLREKNEFKDETGKKIRIPVCSLVLYYGEKEWKSSCHLKDHLNIPKAFLPYVSDYTINVIPVAFTDPKKLELFRSDFGILANFLVHKRKGETFRISKDHIVHWNELMMALMAFEDDGRYLEFIKEENKEEDSGMEKMIDRWINEGKQEGEKEGKKEGIKETKKENALRLLKNGKLTDEEISECIGIDLMQVKQLKLKNQF